MAARGRVYWQCRRGMLELDLLLERFLEQGYESLDADQQAAFEQLLTYPDGLLLEYLMGRMVPRDAVMSCVIKRVRHTP